MRQFGQKQRRCIAYDAQNPAGAGFAPSRRIISQPLRQFWWRFVTLKGYVDGLHGLRLSLLMAWYEFRKYRLLRQLWQAKDFSEKK
ncbi:MAG: hypothetical protein LC121_09540 [Anaerolineae bacterium]|nr:hypothetical protein [Anaerolineae bacterium]